MKQFFTSLLLLLVFQLQAQISIEAARSANLNSQVTVTGIVTSGSELGDIRYFQDETAGLAAYPGSGSVSGLGSLQPGDEIEITGTLIEFNGLLELNPVTALNVISTGNPIPEPKIVSVGEIGDSFESQLVTVSCVEFNSTGNFNVGAIVGQGANGETFNTYINSGNPLIGNTIPTDVINLTGIVTAFNNPQMIIPATGGLDTEAVCFNITHGPVQLDIQAQSFKLYWETSVPAAATVRWGQSISMDNEVLLSSPALNHDFTIPNLEPATFYYVQVEANYEGTAISTTPKLYSTGSASTGEIRVYFNQDTDPSVSMGLFPYGTSPLAVKDAIIERIDLAQNTIDLAIYNINDMDIVNALNEAVIRGVNVRVVADDGASNAGLQGNLNFEVLFGNSNGLMHNKFLSIDADSPLDAWVVMGSMNFSEQNIFDDFNNVIIFQDQAVAKAYRIEFEEMWGGSGLSPNPSNAKFGSDKVDNTPHLFKVGDTYLELYFAPSDRVLDRIDEALATTDNDLSMALLLITQNRLRDRIINLNDGSRWIRGIVESINLVGSDFQALVNDGVDMVHHDETYDIHHKYAIVDYYYNEVGSPMVINGSYNWSAAAEEKNDENTIIWHSYNIANLFMQEFEQRWGISATSVSNEVNPADLSVVPNPIGDRFYVSLPADDCQLQVYNALGGLVYSTSSDQNNIEIESMDWKAGIYFVQVESLSTGTVISTKLVKH